ncbi:MAG: adenylate/guanylate cyclase domain-containing protein [Ardenticatenaceae bacterium]|nr:adenylate/guanylate cyclase domain-containing protein [Anaerolineales bacterium]MCB8920339.1 adenylate/guanylate cyclase domain-containing protein [Ardenticatenaceae bacterium]
MSQLTQQIEGTARSRILREFILNSAVYPVFDGIRAISVDGISAYLLEIPHYFIFVAAAIQAWYLGKRPSRSWIQQALGNLIAPTLYTLLDISLEGFTRFWQTPYHTIYWVFSLGMAFLYACDGLLPRWRRAILLLINLWRVLLFPTLYAVSELSTELSPNWGDLRTYLLGNSAHFFILLAALLFGLLLGVREIERDHYMQTLRQIARSLKQVSEWSLDSDLLAQSLKDQQVLEQHRVLRAVLFMDIRNFTRWSDSKSPETVVNMLNQFYELAEQIIVQGGGSKPHFIGDEVMTWFPTPAQAVETARVLNQRANQALGKFDLATGMGIHWGEVVEGLMGSSNTRNFNILGDTVNTTSRLVSAAQPGEVLLSEALVAALDVPPPLGGSREIQAKGKERPLQVYVIREA